MDDGRITSNETTGRVVQLDVGGTMMSTTLGTLVNAFPESRLACHFRGKGHIVIDDDGDQVEVEPFLGHGPHFIDVDPRIFAFILCVLRRPMLYSSYMKEPPTGVTAVEWSTELQYWGIYLWGDVLSHPKSRSNIFHV